jgi:hypothetical protein
MRLPWAKGPFEEILRYAGGGNGATVLWIEPLMKKVVTQGGLFEWLNQKLLEPAGTYIRRKLGGNPPDHYVKAEFRVFRAFAPKEDVRVTLAATIFETGRFQ